MVNEIFSGTYMQSLQPCNQPCFIIYEFYTNFIFLALVFIGIRLLKLLSPHLPICLLTIFFFSQEAIAYFPLVMLVSGAFSSFMVKKISRRLGTKVRSLMPTSVYLTTQLLLFFIIFFFRETFCFQYF